MLPTNSSFDKLPTYYRKEEHIKQVNAGLQKIAPLAGVVIIDLYSAFVDADGSLVKNLTFDGVHLTKEGYYKWAAILKKGNYLGYHR